MPQIDLSGTGVALITPFRDDYSIDFNSFEKLIEHVIKNDINYLVVLGTTGESVTLGKDEKNALVNFVLDINNGRLPIVLGIGGNNTQAIVNNIKSAKLEKISAILSVAPYYNKPNQTGLYLHYKSIATASSLPVILYNVPGRTSSNISAETTLKLAKEFKNIIAVKEASGNFTQIMQIIKNKSENFLVISGDDALTLPMISVGGSGVISVVANAFPKQFSDMVNFARFKKLSQARKLHYLLIDLIGTLFAEGSPAGIKAALNILGITPNNLRLPLVPVSKKTYDELAKQIEEITKYSDK